MDQQNRMKSKVGNDNSYVNVSGLAGKRALDWNTRKRIAIAASRGLLYLHEQCDPKIIHRDVEAANVLLDDYCEPIVGDFGLAKLLDHADSHVTCHEARLKLALVRHLDLINTQSYT
ncbi:hypothetical protein PTKIN_Ptkin19aG0021600 [Pterospermum kingtungense]